MCQKALTSLHNILVSQGKISGVPWIGNIPGVIGVVQETADFTFRVASGNFCHVPDVGGIRSQKVVILSIIFSGHLYRMFSPAGDAVLCQFLPGRRINRTTCAVPDFFRACGSGSYVKLVRNSNFLLKQIQPLGFCRCCRGRRKVFLSLL